MRIAAPVLILLFVATACGSTSSPAAQAAPAGQNGSSGGATCSYPPDGAAAKPVSAPPGVEPDSGTVSATINLTGGAVTIAMDRSKTPCTVGSFVHLAAAGYFNSTPCHRLTTAASLRVLQCGDPTGLGTGGPGYSFADETNASMTYLAGTVAMANSGANTNGSQFFLVYADSGLPPDYTVFGKITSGLNVLTAIAAAGVAPGGQSSEDGSPAKPVTISTVTITGS